MYGYLWKVSSVCEELPHQQSFENAWKVVLCRSGVRRVKGVFNVFLATNRGIIQDEGIIPRERWTDDGVPRGVNAHLRIRWPKSGPGMRRSEVLERSTLICRKRTRVYPHLAFPIL